MSEYKYYAESNDWLTLGFLTFFGIITAMIFLTLLVGET